MYLVYAGQVGDRAQITDQYSSPWPEILEQYPNGFYMDIVPQPEKKEGFAPVLMVKLSAEGSKDEPELYYDYVAIPEPEETQLQRLQKQVDMLSAQAATLATGQEMQEDVITEIVMHVYE